MTDSECPAGFFALFTSFPDSIPNLQEISIQPTYISDRAFYIWKRYGNSDSVSLSPFFHIQTANYFLAEKEIRMESRLKEVFQLLDEKGNGECSFRQLLSFGDFIGVEWTLLYLREAFNVYDGTEDSILNLSQFLQFCVNELNGLDILLSQ